MNRIFEGTNEINRLLIPGRLLRRAMKGELPVLERAEALLAQAAPPASRAEGFLAAETAMAAGAKNVALLCLGLAARRFQQALSDEQEVLGHFADIAMECYALESAVLRARKAGPRDALAADAVRCFARDAMDRVETSARRLLSAVAEGGALEAALSAVARFAAREPANTVALRRRVADAAIEAGGYPFHG